MEISQNNIGYTFLIKSIFFPVLFLVSIYLTHTAYIYLAPIYFPAYIKYASFKNAILDISLIIGIFWLLRNIIDSSKTLLLRWAIKNHHPLISMIYPILVSCIKGIGFLVFANMTILVMDIQKSVQLYLDKAIKIFIILFITRIILQVFSCLESYVIDRYIDNNDDLQVSMKVRTQVVVLKRIINFLIITFALIAISMLFDGIKSFGVSLLTTAGIISAIVAFASQQSIARIFAGLQLAFTQPLRIGDTVVIDKELGQVEEITLSNITIKLWDLRRLIIPTDYFTNKGLVNLTAESSELLGTVYFYTDYTLPVDTIRVEFQNILNKSEFWNKKSSSLDITDFKQNSMEFRCLVSADDAGKLWKLRCEIREKLMAYIVKNHPECLTKSRSVSIKPSELEFQNE